ncbi:Collagen alpha-3(VI) chain [Nibea albiflora]|nr:Collagen alpha-3(VI) chain [Nibea albiflora]
MWGKTKTCVSVVQYSRDAEINFYLNTYATKEDIVDSVRGLKHRGGTPLNTGAALQYLRDNVFTASAGSRRQEGVPQVLVLLSGGRSFDRVNEPASALKQMGVQIFAIGSRMSDRGELQTISHDPSNALFVSEFTDLPTVQEQLSSVMGRVLVRATPMTPTVTVERKPAGKDVVFLLDGSEDTRSAFRAMRDFVQRVVETLSVDDNKDRVSVVQYSRDPAVQFYLNTYTTKGEILDTVRGLSHKGGRPLNTGAALQYLRDNVFTASAGSRRQEGVPQVLVLLSGGRSFDRVNEPASALKQMGVQIFAIGSRRSDRGELQTLSHDPSNALFVSEFTDLPTVEQQLQSSVEAVVTDVTPESPTVPVDTVKKDIVFLLDGSDGTRRGFPAMRDFVERAVEKLNVGQNKDRVSVVQYSRDAEVKFYLNTYATKEDIVDSVRGLKHRGGTPLNTGAALQYLRDNVFTASAGSRRQEGVPQVLVLLSGGRSFDRVNEPASALIQMGVQIFAIGSRMSDRGELQTISHDPSNALFVSEFTDLPTVQEQLSSVMGRVLVRATPMTPTVTVERKPAGKDVVFLLDGSEDTRSAFQDMRDFVQRVVDTLSVDDNKDRVSVVQYSRDPAVQFYLNTYTTKGEILDTVRGLSHKGGRPLNTGAALQYLRDNVFTASAGSRRKEGVPQVLVLLSGGRSFDRVNEPASALKQMGVQIFAIGSRKSDRGELQTISQDPSNALFVSEFTDLPTVEQQLQSSVEAVVTDVTPESPTVPVDTVKKDIVFLLDGSDGTRRGFPAMRDFVERAVEKLNVGQNKDRVSVVQYSRDAEVNFYLNTYATKEDIVDSVRGLKHRGGTPLNTGAALQYLRDNVFTASAGSRRQEGVPQVLVLLSGGRSFDRVNEPASALKQMGVQIFAIGSRMSDRGELQTISHDPSNALFVSEFTDLPTVQEQLSSVMGRVLVRATPMTPTVTVERKPAGKDVVFLLDGSEDTRSAFRAMRDFVQRVVETLSVDDNKDRVSVVQYSRDPAVQFYLNTYTTKGEILDTVRSLSHKGGRPLNTGAALQYLRDNVFTASAGSRRKEGVPQVLVLLSGGRSFDRVNEPASALKQMGVQIFAIGSRRSDRGELQTLSHDPSNALFVSEFTDLPTVEQQLQSSVEAVVTDVTPESPTVPVDTVKKDIVFLLDGSDGTRRGFPAMRDFVERAVEKLNVGQNKDRVSVVQYSRDAEVNFYLNTYATKEDIVDSVRGLKHRGGTPLNTGAALQYVRNNVFTHSSGSRRVQGVPQLLILLNGGKSFDNVDAPASALKQQGISVIGIGTSSSDINELQKISYDPTYALSVSNFTALPTVQEQLSSVMGRVLVRATPMTPTVTVERKPAGKDVVFLLDGSEDTRSAFRAMRDFVQRVVETLSVDDNKDRVSVVQYSRDPAVQFYLNTFTTKGEILDTVRGLSHKGGRPLNTGAALQYLRDNVFTASAGSRRKEGVPQVLVLLSGGRSFDRVNEPASALKQMGVQIFAIGSRRSDRGELQTLSHDPSNALFVSEFTDLPTVEQQLQSSVEAVVTDVTPESPTVPVDTVKKDIVFLLDGSDGTRRGFPAMRDFVERAVEKLNVGQNKDRVSVVQYSRDAEVNFYLNTYATKEDIVDSVRGLKHRGGTPLNTGAALQYVRNNVFTHSSGSRRVQGVPQLLILLNGGKSFDNVDAPASALKQQGISVIGIGTSSSDINELQKISYDPTYALSVSNFTALPTVQEQLSSVMGRVLVRATPMTPTVTVERKPAGKDVVFLLDGSEDTRSAFQDMRDFVQRVVDTLSVDDNKDRVSVVQYSRDPAVQFYLNTYTTKGEILDTVRGLSHKGGRPLNTGAALQYLRGNVFTASAGSRRQEGVPQVLVLLSGGRSFDRVNEPASALKQMGVQIFAIGSRRSDRGELQTLSHDPSNALFVSEFTDLPTVELQLQSSVEDVVTDVTPESPTVPVDTVKKDIVFLLDGSDGTRRGFPAMRDFVERAVEKLNVGQDKDRVSVVQYSRDAEINFYLNTYATKEDIVDSVRGLKHRGGTPLNTGAALQYLRDNVFTASAGSRRQEGVPQVLVLLSGGRSFDRVNEPASALKQMGVQIFAIGSRMSDRGELQTISHDPSNALFVSEFTDLPTVQEQLSSVMGRVLVRATPMTPTVTVERKPAGKDVVFLLDGSEDTRSAFRAMRDFVQRVVETLSVDDNKDRVSVVQYSRDPAVQFYLNTYTTKGEILDTVRGLSHKGGRPLNTGAALQYLRDNVFTASAGSRRQEGVPQVLVLLSGGRSFDRVNEPASALKQMGVQILQLEAGGLTEGNCRHYPTIQVMLFSCLNSLIYQLLSSNFSPQWRLWLPMSRQNHQLYLVVDTVKKDIVFLLDGSDGTRRGFPAMRDFVERAVEKLNVGQNKDRVSVVQYSRDAEVNFYLNTYATKRILWIRNNVFTHSSGSRRVQGVPQLLILLNGGKSFDNVDAPASALKQQGISVIGIGTSSSDINELQKISYDPTYALSVSNFTALPTVQEQLSSVMGRVLVRATPMTPTVTVERKPAGKDVVFLLDGSEDTRSAFQDMRDFVQRVVDTLSVDDNKDRVSVVQYSRDPAVQFYLNTYTTKGEILDTVRGLSHKGGRPLNTGAALQYLRDNVFTASAGSRRKEGVPQVLVLLSGGRSFDRVNEPASALKQMGVQIFAIGSRKSDRGELQTISHDPSNALFVSEFTDLPTVEQQLQSSVEAVVTDVTPESPTVPVDTVKKDIVFLLDGSDGTRRGFPAMRDFVERAVEKLNVGQDKDRVSVVQYSRDAEINFYLNTYATKEDIVDSVRGLKHRGGTPLNTGAALQYLRDNVFTASAGSRRQEGVPQVLVLLSGGRSFDRVNEPASALKQMGVQIFAIGSRMSDRGELQTISHDPSNALFVSEFTDLPTVQEQLSSVMGRVLFDTVKKDIVFLLDGSDGTRRGFPAMRDFVERAVEKLNVGQNKDRVSVVQYSRDAEVNFYLNTYATKEDIVDSVRGLKHRGGTPLNTGAALQYLRDNVFTASAGSRRQEGVPQVLVLLSGGRSFDRVNEPASALKQMGVQIFAIGSRMSDRGELQTISHDPSNALFVSEFTDLPTVQEQLSSVMGRVLVRATPMTPTVTVERKPAGKDVVFLLDGSEDTRSAFRAMRDFVQRVVETLSVDDNKDRVSVVQYSRDPAVQFYLNTYTTKGEILDTVRGLSHKGGRPLNTGAALQYLRDNVFTASAGSRRKEGVPQVLVLLSGGRSFDRVNEPASALKQMGVQIFAIGSRRSDRGELQTLSHDPIDTVKKDIVFLLDGSDGTRRGFPAMRDFVERAVEKLNVGQNKDRVSVVQYSRDAEVNFYLNTYATKEDIVDSVRGLKHRGGTPLNTGAALQYLRDNVFTASAGSRRQEGVPQVLVLLSGGRSFDRVNEPASALKQMGVQIFAIGSRMSDRGELQTISHDPSNALFVSEFTDLPTVQEQLSSVMGRVLVRATPMTPTVTVERKPAGKDVVFLLDGSEDTRSAFRAMRDFVQRVVETLSVDDNRDRVSVVQYSRDPAVQFYLNTYTTKGEILDTVRVERKPAGKDVVFLLDGSEDTRSAFQAMRDFVQRVVDTLSVDDNKDRVSVVQYSRDPAVQFYLNTYTTKGEILDTVRGLSHKGGRPLNTGAALQYLRDNVFTASAGSRRKEGVPQVLVLLSVDTVKKDIVFLLDGSDGTRRGFPAMRDFVERAVEKLNVGQNKDRVSVVQYSRDAEVNFYLNTYATKEDIVDSVRGLKHRGGTPLNTGAALQYLRDNVFTASAGSRRQEGVPQVLVLLSGGRSFDRVNEPASALKQMGVQIFAIGSRMSDRGELQTISHDPSNALFVSEFTDLPTVQEQLSSVMGRVLVRATPMTPTVTVDTVKKDIVFLLDGSDGTRRGFPAMRDFVERAVEKLNVGQNKDRVSVVQYSRDAEVNFYLNTYATKEDIVDSVRGLLKTQRRHTPQHWGSTPVLEG